ncbi:MAG TPA: GldM family protein [Chitinophagales bacterium]|nr:GldM family protein [Chitinophagales bacterium]
MKFLLLPLALALSTFGESSHFLSSLPASSDPMAVFCNDSAQGTIKYSDLVKCDGLKIIDSTTREELSFQITSYEVIIIHKSGDPTIELNSGAAFTTKVKNQIQQLKPEDQIIIRKIKAQGPDNYGRSMNTIVLKVQ